MFDEYPDILTPTQVEKILGIGRNSMYNLLKSNVIKSKKIGRKYLIPKIYLIAYVNS